MKKTLMTLALLFMATQAFAALSNAGGISNWKAQKDSNGDVVLKVISTDPSGTPIPTPAASTGVFSGGSASFTWTQTPTVVTWTASATYKSIDCVTLESGDVVYFEPSSISWTAPATLSYANGISVTSQCIPGDRATGEYLWGVSAGTSVVRIGISRVP